MELLKENFYREIKKAYPLIQSDDLRIFNDGWDYLVCVVKDREVFRFPRRSDYAKTLPRETKFLNIFSSQSPTPVPRMALHNLPGGYPYARYKFISGVPFDIEKAKNCSEDSLNKIAKELGEFLTALHSFPKEEAKQLGFQEGDLLSMWEGNFAKTRRMIFPLIEQKDQRWVEFLFSDFFEVAKRYTVENRLTHSDISPRHILVNMHDCRLSGIIDFGDMVISDPAFDFAFLGKYGKEFLDATYSSYGLKRDEGFDKRRQFYETRSLFSEIEHAIELEDKPGIDISRKQLTSYIKTHPANN